MDIKDVFSVTNSGYKIFAGNHLLARALNRKLRQYKDGDKLYSFRDGEEAIFVIDKDLYQACARIYRKYG